MVLTIIASALTGITLLISIYYLVLLITAAIFNRKDCLDPSVSDEKTTFAIIIPAHNEEKTILKTINSCNSLDYPKSKYTIYVIADNCTDRTEEIVLDSSARCLTRTDQHKKGKGYALEWAFKNTLKNKHDAYIVIDADCEIDSHALKVFDQYIQKGFKVLQANDISSNPDESPMSYAVTVGNIIENNLYYMPKDKLNLAIQLRGTGMVFTRQILEEFEWSASSMVEDMEYTLNLFRNDIRIKYIKEANVSSDFPTHKEQLDIQRTRWAGNLSFGKKDALILMIKGILRLNPILIDASINFLILSRPLVLLILLSSLLFSGLNHLSNNNDYSFTLLLIACACFLIEFIYFMSGIILLGITKKRILFLAETPVIIIRLIIISLKGLFGINSTAWNRTPRDKEE